MEIYSTEEQQEALLGDPAFGQKQIEQCFFPQLQEWLDRDLRNADKCTVTSKGAVRDQSVDVGMPMRELAESVDAYDHSRCDIAAIQDGVVDLQDRLPGQHRQLT